jgi:hypothetical protein
MNFKKLNKPLLVMALVIFMIVPMMMAIGTVKATTPLGGTIGLAEANPKGGAGQTPASIVTGTPVTSWTQTESLSPLAGNPYSSTYVGDVFYLDVVISNVPYTTSGFGSSWAAQTDLYGYFFNLNWSPSTLELTSVKEGNFLNQWEATDAVGTSSALYDNVHGTLLGGFSDGYSSTTQLEMTEGAAGSQSAAEAAIAGTGTGAYGVLVQLQFTVVGAGTGTVTVSGALLYDNSADAQATNGVAPTLSGNTASVTLNIPTSTLQVISPVGDPSPAIGSYTELDGTIITATVPTTTVVSGTVLTCTGWTGTGSVVNPSNGDYSGTTNSITFEMDSTLSNAGTSTLTWNWAAASTTLPQAVITSSPSYAYVNQGLGLSAANSEEGIETSPASVICPITSYAWTITLVSGTVLTPTTQTVALTAAQVGTTSGTITAQLTITAPSVESDPSYTTSTSTTSVTITVLANSPTGSISLVSSGTTTVSPINVQTGQTISVDLYISGASNVFGWSTGVTWNPAVLQLQSVTEGPYLSSSGATFFIGNNPSLFDNTVGKIDGGISDAYETAGETSPSSSGVLVTLTFLAVGNGNGNLALPNAQLVAGQDATPTTVSTVTVSSLFVMPEYLFGGLLALVAAFAGFIAFAAIKRGISISTLSKRIK